MGTLSFVEQVTFLVQLNGIQCHVLSTPIPTTFPPNTVSYATLSPLFLCNNNDIQLAMESIQCSYFYLDHDTYLYIYNSLLHHLALENTCISFYLVTMMSIARVTICTLSNLLLSLKTTLLSSAVHHPNEGSVFIPNMNMKCLLTNLQVHLYPDLFMNLYYLYQCFCKDTDTNPTVRMLDDEDKKWSVSKLYDQLIQEEKYLIQSDQFSSVYSSF